MTKRIPQRLLLWKHPTQHKEQLVSFFYHTLSVSSNTKKIPLKAIVAFFIKTKKVKRLEKSFIFVVK
jgi:hypothetical protein